MKRIAIGIDIGGTNIKAGLVDELGVLISSCTIGTERTKPKEVILSKIVKLIKDFQSQSSQSVSGIGISCPGRIDFSTGTIVGGIANVPTLTGVEIGKLLSGEFNLPTVVDNDANCAAFAEFLHGEHNTKSNMLCITLGTGIGGGIVINKEVYRGNCNYAGEIGHTIVIPGGLECTCGNMGCLEAYAGATGIVKQFNSYRKKGMKTSLSKLDDSLITVKLICEHANNGDKLSIQMLDRVGYFLGLGLSNAVNLLDVHDIVIGGGISNSLNLIQRSIMDTLERYSLPLSFKKVNIFKATLGNTAGIIGATSLLFEKIN